MKPTDHQGVALIAALLASGLAGLAYEYGSPVAVAGVVLALLTFVDAEVETLAHWIKPR